MLTSGVTTVAPSSSAEDSGSLTGFFFGNKFTSKHTIYSCDVGQEKPYVRSLFEKWATLTQEAFLGSWTSLPQECTETDTSETISRLAGVPQSLAISDSFVLVVWSKADFCGL
jgi:hypothetical protein